MTSSLIRGVPNSSRASFAVVTASRTLRQPAVFGSTVTSEFADQRPELIAGLAAGGLAAHRDGDDLRARCADRLLHDGGRGIKRRADQQARGEVLVVEVQHEIASASGRPRAAGDPYHGFWWLRETTASLRRRMTRRMGPACAGTTWGESSQRHFNQFADTSSASLPWREDFDLVAVVQRGFAQRARGTTS